MSTLRTFFDIDGDMDWIVVSSNTNVVNNKGYIVDTSGGAVTLTLPSSPAVGDTIGVKDIDNNFATNNLTIGRNGHLIEGLASNKTINHDGYSTELVYSGATHGWLLNGESYGDITSHLSNTSNPHSVTQTQVGLSNVNNTSDADKPISSATQTALNGKAATGHNHTGVYEPADSGIQTHISSTSNPHSVTQTQVGLGSVNNTSDADKPVSTAQSTALGLKLDKTDPQLKYFHYPLSTGVLSGGTISINGGDATKIDITPAIVLYVDNSAPDSPMIDLLTCPQQTAITPTGLATASRLWVGVERTGAGTGGIVFSTKFTPAERRIIAQLGRVRSNGTSTILGVAHYKNQAWGVEKTLEDLMVTLGSLNISGNKYSAVASSLTLGKEAGSSFRFGAGSLSSMDSSNIIDDASVSPITSYRYHLAANASATTTVLSTLDVDNYDLSGTLTAVPSGKYSIQRIYLFPGSEATEIVYGQAVYDTLQEAVSNVTMEDVIVTPAQTISLSAGILRGWVCVKKGTTDISDTLKAKIITNTGFGANASSSASVSPVDSVNGHIGVVVLDKTDIGLNNVNNTADADKPISSATQTALNGKADQTFKTISVAGQDNVIADTTTDTLTLSAGTGMTITTNAGSDTITFASTGGGGGAGLTWNSVSSNTSATANNGYFVNTAAGIKTITLPATPALGDQVGISDIYGTFETYKCVVARNGKNIMGVAADFDCDVNNLGILFVYSDATEGWKTVYLAAGVAGGTTGGGLSWNSISSNTSAMINNGYFVDTTTAQVTLTLPAAPVIGDQISIVDYTGTFGTYPCIVARNGLKIMGSSDDFSCNVNNMGISFVYVDATEGWRITYDASGSGGTVVSTIPWSLITTNTTSVKSNGYFVNTTSGIVTLTLPAAASIGDVIKVTDAAGTFASNNLTIGRNGHNIMGAASNYTANTNNLNLELTYCDVTLGWRITSKSVGA